MGSSGKKKTTMAKLARENRLRERRLNKAAKRDARKRASADGLVLPEAPAEEPAQHGASGLEAEGAPSAPQEASEPSDPREKEVALLRLRDAPDEKLEVFGDRLQNNALQAGASEAEMRDAQRHHPGHSA